ncbi:MAG TPA: hypothetical protein VJ792_03895 [Candidatus Nitrosotalea sp.]|nr:hypothetical protein [Candidatus Nitrosotalea sp.]
MALFPKDDILAREIESWKGFADGLRAEDQRMFRQMLSKCYRHVRAINAKGEALPTESLLMSLILSQQQLIEFLIKKSGK